MDPLPWNDYFSIELYLKNNRSTATITHHVYATPPAEKGTKGPLFVTHHGAGSSGLSFALFASEIRKALPHAGVLSVDARGHGATVVQNVGDSLNEHINDLSLDTLSQDLVDIMSLTQRFLDWPELPALVLIGHSLGGAVITNVAMGGKLGNAVLGYAVLDVVEGSAIDALQSMQSYLSTRPKSFLSIPSAIEWQLVFPLLSLVISSSLIQYPFSYNTKYHLRTCLRSFPPPSRHRPVPAPVAISVR